MNSITQAKLDRITLEVAAVLTSHKIPGYEYNEPMNWLRHCLVDALRIVSVETPKQSPQSWFGITRLPPPSKYRSIDDDDWRSGL